MVRPGAVLEPEANPPEVVIGPASTETGALRLVADQLAAYLAAVISANSCWEPDPGLPDRGMTNHLLHELKEARYHALFMSALDAAIGERSND
jgi:hypothetical protein